MDHPQRANDGVMNDRGLFPDQRAVAIQALRQRQMTKADAVRTHEKTMMMHS
jgi:hypothetical protein